MLKNPSFGRLSADKNAGPAVDGLGSKVAVPNSVTSVIADKSGSTFLEVVSPDSTVALPPTLNLSVPPYTILLADQTKESFAIKAAVELSLIATPTL